MREAPKDPGIGSKATRPGRALLGDAPGWRLGRIAGVGLALAGALALAPAVLAAPPAGTHVAITAALSAVAKGRTTLTFTPKVSSKTGAYVAVFEQGKGKGSTTVLVPQTREPQALTAGTKATYTGLPIDAPNKTAFKSVTAYEQTAYNKAVLVAVYAQPAKGLLLPPPGPVPSGGHGGSGKGGNGSLGGAQTAAQLPKTGAGPAMEVLGALLLVGGGVLAVVRPKRRAV